MRQLLKFLSLGLAAMVLTRSQALIQILRDIFKINCSFVSS